MRIEITETMLLDQHHEFSLAELAELSGLSREELMQLIECEALLPANPAAAEATFGAHCLIVARTASRLRNDFELDAGALALTLTLLERIRELEAELRAAHARLPQRLR